MTRLPYRSLALAGPLFALSCAINGAPPADADAATPDAVADAPLTDAPALDAPAPEPPEATRCMLEAPALANAHATVTPATAEIRDALGRQLFLRGVNFGGRSKTPPFLPFEYTDEASFTARLNLIMDRLSSWGVTVLRVPFTWEAFEPTRGTWDEAWFARYRALLDAAWARRIRVIVDFHQDVYARPFCGDGFPLWTLGPIEHGEPRADCRMWFDGYFSAPNDISRAFDRLWTNADNIADAMERMWVELATRTSSHPAVLGYEVLNEPGAGSIPLQTFIGETLPTFTARMARAIRRAAPHAVIIEGGPASTSVGSLGEPRDPGVDNFVYAPHYYDPFGTLGIRYSGTGTTRMALGHFFATGRAWGRPVLVGEFGTTYETPNGGRFLRDVFDALDENLAHGTAWEVSTSTFEWNFEKLSLLTPEGAERPYASEIPRGVARAVDGTVTSMRWDHAAHTFALAVRGARNGVTEVYLPARYVGPNPRVGLSLATGCAHWDAASQTLLVRAEGDYTLTARSP